MTVDPWAFGWEAIAAIGSVLASTGAVVAAYLAVRTGGDSRKIAEAAQISASAAREEVAAAWRPVMIPTGEGELVAPAGERATLSIHFINQGRGVALDIVCEIVDGEDSAHSFSTGQPAPPGMKAVFNGGTSEPLDDALIQFAVTLHYTDLGKRRYRTSTMFTLQVKSSSKALREYRLIADETEIHGPLEDLTRTAP